MIPHVFVCVCVCVWQIDNVKLFYNDFNSFELLITISWLGLRLGLQQKCVLRLHLQCSWFIWEAVRWSTCMRMRTPEQEGGCSFLLWHCKPLHDYRLTTTTIIISQFCVDWHQLLGLIGTSYGLQSIVTSAGLSGQLDIRSWLVVSVILEPLIFYLTSPHGVSIWCFQQ